MDDWSVKDILAHLVDWELRLIQWYHQGFRGEKPQTPAPGMTWRELPKLNQMDYEKHKDEPLEQYEKSHQEIYHLVESMQEKEIFEKIITPGPGNIRYYSGLMPIQPAIMSGHSETSAPK